VTWNDSSVLINLNKPFWDTGNLTQSYNLTCSLASGNVTYIISEMVDVEEESASFSLDTSDGYTCCAAVVTDIGNGPATCRPVAPLQPLPDLRDSNTEDIGLQSLTESKLD